MRLCPTLSTTRGKRITAKLPCTPKKHKACAPIAQCTLRCQRQFLHQTDICRRKFRIFNLGNAQLEETSQTLRLKSAVRRQNKSR